MSAHTSVERDGVADADLGSRAAQLARVESGIDEAERLLEEQEQRVRQAVLSGRDATQDKFNLQKMQLILTLLREGHARLLRRMDGSR